MVGRAVECAFRQQETLTIMSHAEPAPDSTPTDANYIVRRVALGVRDEPIATFHSLQEAEMFAHQLGFPTNVHDGREVIRDYRGV